MKVAIGADHAGFHMKQQIVAWLTDSRFEVLDLGTDSTEPADYPDFAEAVGLAILEGRSERGVL